MTRIGKIARLARNVREELIRRLEDGEEGASQAEMGARMEDGKQVDGGETSGESSLIKPNQGYWSLALFMKESTNLARFSWISVPNRNQNRGSAKRTKSLYFQPIQKGVHKKCQTPVKVNQGEHGECEDGQENKGTGGAE